MPAPEPMNRPAPMALPRPIIVSCRGLRAAPRGRSDVLVCCSMGSPLVVGRTDWGKVSELSGSVGCKEPEHALVGGGVRHGNAETVALVPTDQDAGVVERVHEP